ncbi:hypothetical protein BU25DRAFT_38558 [Macroventuria anomochaeta]|uniref:Uncharacterized protein n=1 Tax=Macroventuria anomochaeta TaxID=301207 RepID=A0ACB6S497_9PLEO|nr:uncharacterized protein BU25DRAFT_38558 [Macroventuria anomochaeta]KAF2628029.1 hypothetical protein BU25DRAFT_38558 [Macroventuria anomochaeta]
MSFLRSNPWTVTNSCWQKRRVNAYPITYANVLFPDNLAASNVADASTIRDATMNTSTTPCSCLSLAYLATSQLQCSVAGNDLPTAMADLKAALASANAILKCLQCPKQMVTAMQNLLQVGSLLLTLVGRMQTLLAQVDAGVDINVGTLQDPSVVMNEHQFRLFFRKTLKETILGSHIDTGDSTLLGVMHQFEERQQDWHADPQMYERQAKLFGKRTATNFAHECQSRVCGRLIELLKASISSLEL